MTSFLILVESFVEITVEKNIGNTLKCVVPVYALEFKLFFYIWILDRLFYA